MASPSGRGSISKGRVAIMVFGRGAARDWSQRVRPATTVPSCTLSRLEGPERRKNGKRARLAYHRTHAGAQRHGLYSVYGLFGNNSKQIF